MRKINNNLILFSGILLLLLFLSFEFLKKLSPFVRHVTYFCQSFIETHIVPIPQYISLIPLGVIFLIFFISLTKVLFYGVKAQVLRRSLKEKVRVDSRAHKIIESLGLSSRTIVVHSPENFAYCLGIRAPRIYISSGLTEYLDANELTAVLRHEEYHLRNRDTLIMLIASITQSFFLFFPSLIDLIKKYKVDREIAADSYAVSMLGSSTSLVSALKKLLVQSYAPIATIASIADEDTLEERILALTIKTPHPSNFQIKNILTTLLFSFIFITILVVPVQAQEIHHEHHDLVMLCSNGSCMNTCTNEVNLNRLYSELPMSSKIKSQSSSVNFTPAQ